jgi:transcriptional regulator with XRE-family HTH domain
LIGDGIMFDFDDEDKDNPIGSLLRYYREKRKLDLDHIAEELKIRLDYLKAMERGRFDLVPAGIYRRSFLRAYAEYLKLDADNILKMLVEQKTAPGEAEKESPPSYRVHAEEAAGEEKPIEEAPAAPAHPPLEPPPRTSGVGYAFSVFLGLVIGALCVMFLFRIGIESHRSASLIPTLAMAESVLVIPEPPDTMELFIQLLDDKIGTAPELVLRMEAAGRSWIQIFADGAQLYSGFVNENMSAEFRARDEFFINLGVKQGLRAFLNGFELVPLTEERTRLNRENFTEFIPTHRANEFVRAYESIGGTDAP